MKKQILAGAICLALVFTSLLPLSGCGTVAALSSEDLMSGVTANQVSQDVAGADSPEDAAAVADFAARLFQNSADGESNVLISPISVLYALALTVNGAKGETRAQMEQVLGLSTEELNKYLHAYLQTLPSDEKASLSLANAIWMKEDDRLSVQPAFLQTNADWYGAGAYKAPFDDSTLKDINHWVSDHTGGMIENILDNIPKDAVLYLVNALAFDAEWADIYKEDQVRDGTFTTESGEQRDAEMMYGEEYRYLSDGMATGFLKYYAGDKYAFMAMLPNEGVTLSDYIDSLSGQGLQDILSGVQETKVRTMIPKFQSEYSVEMSDLLKAMGMTDAFDPDAADFSGMATYTDGNICISRVLHKTHIAVDERGTKAGAATVVEMVGETAMPAEEPKTVYLDRPFVYLLIDCEKGLPLFIGTMTDVGK
ncbi:MAG: serpin family protein [Clostridiaceae bacterium]|nr:serpin family protein [Clostridiaceae bacterium]